MAVKQQIVDMATQRRKPLRDKDRPCPFCWGPMAEKATQCSVCGQEVRLPAEKRNAILRLRELGFGTYFSSLGAVTKIRSGVFPHGPITDKSLEEVMPLIEAMEPFSELSLCGTRITDAGLRSLSHLKGVEVLRIIGSRASEAGLRELEENLPNVRLEQ